jgi:ABC-type dipeptide/oligopeptide/nickel transport system ATPase component
MSKTFKIPRAPYDKGDNLYKKATFTFEPGVTVLVGCNGSGKSTLLTRIKENLKEDPNVICVFFDNYNNNRGKSTSRHIFHGNYAMAATLMLSSEGENILTNLGEIAQQIGGTVRANQTNNNPLFVILDAVDSGFSVDNIIDLKEYLFNTILEDNQGKREVYIICAANEYELCNGENCFDVQNAKYIKFKNYEEYRKFILKSKEIKNKRFEN